MSRKVEYIFDPEELTGEALPEDEDARKEVLGEISDYVLESVLSDVADTRSPVTGRMFKKLSKDYAKKKQAEGGSPVPNLELFGDLLGATQTKVVGGKVKLYVGSGQSDKADGHCNHSGESELPKRTFIPDDAAGETLRPEIRAGIARLMKAARGE